MALGTNHFTQADLDEAIPVIWGEKINDYFRYALKLAPFFVERSDELMGGGDTVKTLNLSAMAVNTKANGSEVTLNSPTYTSADLVVSTWKECSFLIEDREMKSVKQSWNLQNAIAEGSAYEVAKDLDTAIAALFAGFSTTFGASSTNIADSDLLAALATMENTGVPGLYDGMCSWVLHPNTFYRQIGTIDKFTVWQNTNSEQPRTKRPTQELYGVKAIVTPAVPVVLGARQNVLVHKDAIHWARLSFDIPFNVIGYTGSEGVRVMQSYVHEYMGTLVTTDICYGAVENRDNAGIRVLSHATVA